MPQKIENFNFTQYGCIGLRTDAMLSWGALGLLCRAKPENYSPFLLQHVDYIVPNEVVKYCLVRFILHQIY